MLIGQRGEEWMRQHYQHLKVDYGNFKDIVKEDQLQLEQHLDSWLKEKRFPIAFLKYEKMWDHQKDISEFLGFEVNLPTFKERKARKNVDIEFIATLERNYVFLKDKVDDLQDFIVKGENY